MYSVLYLTLTAGDKGIKCPSVSSKQCKKGPSGAPPLATMAILSASHATAHRWLHSLLPRAPGKAPGQHVGGCARARVQSGSLPRQAPCRRRCLVAPGSLSLARPCRDAWRVAASSLGCLGWPSRQAPLAGVLSPGLNTLFLNGSKGTTEDLGGRSASLAAGCCNCPCTSLNQVLGYPYSSTPTGAPGPGPHTVPSAIGPSPK